MMKLAVLSATVAATAAFAPSGRPATKSALFSGQDAEEGLDLNLEEMFDMFDAADKGEDFDEAIAAVKSGEASTSEPAFQPINGWVPDKAVPCYGLPGAVAPTGYFDPLGFAQNGIGLNDVKRNREAEVMHGRVAMIACLGYFAGEAIPSPLGITGPANDQLQQVPLPLFVLLSGAIAFLEIRRAQIGWVEPDVGNWSKTLWTLRDGYYPGDVGFDPLGLKPKDAGDFASMQTKELQNGRLAMIGWAGMCAQELVNHRTIAGTIEFYQKVYAGVNPYENCADGIIC